MMVIKSDLVNQVLGRNQKSLIFQLYDSRTRSGNCASSNLLEITRSGRGATSIGISFKREHLVLKESHGSLSYEIFPVSERICVSVVYSTPESIGDLKFNIMFSNGTKYEESKYTERQFGEWKMRIFKSSLGKMTNDKINLQLDVSGKGTILHSIFGCNPSGQKDITVMENDVNIPDPVMKLQDFKGCGPLFFGRNCSSECSNFATGCIGMIFCKKNMPCRCAAGFEGTFCEKECASGYYGASCSQKCGHCKYDYCDKFTGYCHYGCEPGFGRPFCRIPYKYSKISPLVTYQGVNVVTVEINTDEVEGIGETEYYQLQYREDKNTFWTELQPHKLRDTVIATNISDLLPGVDYRMRVIYIDKDGNSYQQSKVPTTLFSTLCTVLKELSVQTSGTPVAVEVPKVSFKAVLQASTSSKQVAYGSDGGNVLAVANKGEFLKPRSNVHSEIMKLAHAIHTCFDNVTVHEREPSAPNPQCTNRESEEFVNEVFSKTNNPKKCKGKGKKSGIVGQPRVEESPSTNIFELQLNSNIDVIKYHVVLERGKNYLKTGLLKNSSSHIYTLALIFQYDSKNILCPVTGYTIVLQRNWNKVQFNVSSSVRTFVIDMLLPGVSYEVKIKAITAFGDGPFSIPLSVKTRDEAPLHVSNLQVTKEDSRKLRVSWKPPKFTGGSLQNFVVKYKCIRLLACEETYYEDAKEISVPGNQNYVDLAVLRPHAQYFIEVAAISGIPGPYTSIEAATQDAAPVAAPEKSESPIVTSTNTTISVQWLPLKSCSFLNGYLVGYGYTLYSENRTILATGNTRNTHIAFDDLTPQASYFVHVHVISSGGWNRDKELIINASTAATVPDGVQNMSIYKRGRREIGVRWGQPFNTYGDLESFSISYCRSNDCKSANTIRVQPAPCVPWPELFCHSISNLTPNTQYSVSIRARNVLVNDYGEAVTVNTVTSEGVPEAPTSLFASARTSDSVTLEWGPPFVFNGILRSFLINVEQLDSANSSHCCVYSPLQEVPVKSEDGKYQHKVIDLMPASKYIIGVSAKTISIGPSAFITLSTSPERPELNRAPKLLDNNRVKLPLGEGFPGINGTYLLLVLLSNGNSTSLIWNSEVDKELCSLVPTSGFYIVEEYNAEVMQSTAEEEMEFLEVEIGQGKGPRNGTIGVLEDPILPSEFRVGLALVLDYNGAVSVGFVSAEAAQTDFEDEFA
ncbi:Protein sidekick [Gryllus bimaculatus]|nr:Protein sidekick [Gryllus bimaculatus]